VYSVTKELLRRGVLQEDLASPVKALVAAPPEALSVMTAREEDRLKEKKEIIEKAINEIRSMPTVSGYVAPTITFIPEEHIAQYMHQREHEWNKGLMDSDKTWWGFQDVSLVSTYGDWIESYWKQAPKEIVVKLFSNDEAIEREMQTRISERRNIRYWKGDHAFTCTMWVIGDNIVTINTRQAPFTLVEMRDHILAQNLRTVFSALWGTT